MFDKIRKASEKVMIGWKTDLDIDEKAIQERKGVPFLHFTRKTGTLIVFLSPIDQLPKKGEYAPFLFNFADREHFVNQMIEMSRYYVKNDGCLICQYYNGTTVKKISTTRAAEIGLAHAMKLRAEFKKEVMA